MGKLSRLLNRAFGGRPGQTLCARVGGYYGPHCVFCRFIGWALKDPDHCVKELDR